MYGANERERALRYSSETSQTLLLVKQLWAHFVVQNVGFRFALIGVRWDSAHLPMRVNFSQISDRKRSFTGNVRSELLEMTLQSSLYDRCSDSVRFDAE